MAYFPEIGGELQARASGFFSSFAKKVVTAGASVAALEVLRKGTLFAASSAMKFSYENRLCLPDVLKIFPDSVKGNLRIVAKTIMEIKIEACEIASIPSNSPECLALGGMIEEILLRAGFQEIILRKLPKKCIEHWFPGHEGALDSTPVRVSRVAISSLFFTFLHQSPFFLDCSTQAMTATLVLSIAYAGLQEITHNPLASVYFHARHNSGVN